MLHVVLCGLVFSLRLARLVDVEAALAVRAGTVASRLFRVDLDTRIRLLLPDLSAGGRQFHRVLSGVRRGSFCLPLPHVAECF